MIIYRPLNDEVIVSILLLQVVVLKLRFVKIQLRLVIHWGIDLYRNF